jgi:hypothetical protein
MYHDFGPEVLVFEDELTITGRKFIVFTAMHTDHNHGIY